MKTEHVAQQVSEPAAMADWYLRISSLVGRLQDKGRRRLHRLRDPEANSQGFRVLVQEGHEDERCVSLTCRRS